MKKGLDKCAFSHITDSWSTPKCIYNYYLNLGFFDPCPLNDNYEIDGLNLKWGKKVFCNPPYSNTKMFIEKAIYEIMVGNSDIVVLLIPVRSDTKYFKRLFNYGCVFEFIEGRLQFNDGGKNAPFPSMFVYISRFNNVNRIKYLDVNTFKDRYIQGGNYLL